MDVQTLSFKKISVLEGITKVEVNNKTNSVSFIAEKEGDILTVKEQLHVLGYPSVEDHNLLVTKAKSFISCASGRVNK